MLIHNVEQNTPEWFAAKAGKPSGSNAKKLITSTGAPSKSMKEYAVELANDLYAGKPIDHWEGNKHTERGHEFEPEAADYYSFLKDVELQIVGFCTDDDERYGFSPDRFINENGILEIKCLSAKCHTQALMYINKNNRVQTVYVQQAQMMLFTSGREYCDSLFYHPDLPSVIVRQLPDSEIFIGLETQIDLVIKERDEIVKMLRAA